MLSGVHNEAHFGLLALGAKYRSLGQGCDAVGHGARGSRIVHFYASDRRRRQATGRTISARWIYTISGGADR